MSNARVRVAVGALTMSLAGLTAWMAHEGTGPTIVKDGVVFHKPYVPTKGDVPTIGFGSTRYEDGRRVTMSDPPIPRARAVQLAKNLNSWEEKKFNASLPGVALYQEEYDLYMDWVGQYGMTNWYQRKSPRTWLLKGEYANACAALLNWRFLAKRDCALSENWGPHGCKGVWTRQLERNRKCTEVQ